MKRKRKEKNYHVSDIVLITLTVFYDVFESLEVVVMIICLLPSTNHIDNKSVELGWQYLLFLLLSRILQGFYF